MLIVAVVGILALAAVVVAGLAYHRAPTRLTCPTCAGPTSAVRPPGVLGRTPGVTWRWCAGCGWQGMGRNGPDWRPGRKVAHDSGFHWGDERLPEDFGFRWRLRAEQSEAAHEEPPHHPSGFRFARPTTETGADGDPTAPGSGFLWGNGSAGAREPDGDDFRWREEREPSEGFRWHDARKPPDDFRWKRSG